MPVWPKTFYTFRANLLTAGMARRLRRPATVAAEQAQALGQLCAQLARTSYWRGLGLEPEMPYAAFRTKVPLHSYEQLLPAVERMQRGEPDVLWPGRCVLFSETAGTTTGQRRRVPATEAMLEHFRAAGSAALLAHTARVGHAGIFRGRLLLLGGSTGLTPLTEAAGDQAFAGEASGIAALSLPAWAERHLYEPGMAISQMPDWEERLAAIAARVLRQDLTLVAGLPPSILQFFHAVRAKAAGPKRSIVNMKALWPNLECLVHTGQPVAPFQEELRHALGPEVALHEVYAAAEGVLAAQDGEAAAGLRVLTDTGVFFEFIPLVDFDPARLEHLGPKAVPLADVKPGIDYVPLLTTPGGLARYILGDIVRFLSTTPPRLVPLGRTHLRLNTFGERLNERQLTEALVHLCARQGWTIVNFHVAPLITSGLTSQPRGRHEWWIELKPGTVSTPTGVQIATQLDVELTRLSEDYAARRKAGFLEVPVVRLVMPGVFEHWSRFHGCYGGMNRTPRSRPDRKVADELAKITHFARD